MNYVQRFGFFQIHFFLRAVFFLEFSKCSCAESFFNEPSDIGRFVIHFFADYEVR